MSAEETKPAVTAETGTVEPTPAPAGVVGGEKLAEVVEPAAATEEPKKEEAVAPIEEKKEEEKKAEKPEEKPVEPIYSGALGYKAPGLKNAFRYSKKYFWFGEEAAVPASSLSHYLRGEKPEVAHPVAAWSSVTGKGLLYFVKHADQKETPAGVLSLSDATELSKDGVLAFHFKLPGGKHSFEAQSAPERNSWFVAVQKAIEDAKAAKEGIVGSDGYKEQLEKLGKPATLAVAAATTPKKSTEATPKPAEGEASAPTEETAAPARAGSSSSSSDEDKDKKKKTKSKSRSVSRGKRASLFGGFLGKKEKLEEKVEEKKEKKAEEKAEKEEEKKEDTPAPAGEPSTAAPVAAPVITEDVPKVEEAKPEETPADEKKEEKKTEEKPKPTKRGSIFGNFVEKLKSPTHEKKESDVVPAPAKEPETTAEAPKTEEAPKIEEPVAVAPLTDGTTETPKAEETKETKDTKPAATTPAKEKSNFFGKFLGGAKEKVKSPTTEKTPEAPKTEEAPKIEEPTAPVPAPVEPAAEVPKEEAPKEEAKEEKKEEPTTETSTPAKKRGSIFGALGGSVKKEKEGEEKPQGLKGLFRNASKAGRSKKEKEPTSTPAKVEETAEPKEQKTDAAPIEEKKEETPAPAAPAEQAAIGDVVPDAVTVGQAPKSTPEVATTA